MVFTWDLVVIIFFTKFFIAVFYILENFLELFWNLGVSLRILEYLELLRDSEKEVVSKRTKSPSIYPCILSPDDSQNIEKCSFAAYL